MEQSRVDRWKELLRDIPLEDPWAQNYGEYLDRLNARSLPIIINLHHLAQLTDIKLKRLLFLCAKPEKNYRQFSIPKRRGGKREILAPNPEMLAAQRWILSNILQGLYVSDYCHSFTANKSIITNAKIHLGATRILKMDLKDFFPSINQRRVISLFRSIGYTRKIAVPLSQICCFDQQLPQGAATSPAISNLVAYRLDCRLAALAGKFDLNYSRYADDLTFSGSSLGKSTIRIITQIVRDEGFMENENKTVMLHSNNQKRVITGISVQGDKLKVPKKKKREIRSEVHNFLNNKDINTSFDNFQPYAQERTIGLLEFWLQVEPESTYAQQKLTQVRAVI